jgi:hypothetical protein
VAEGRGEAAVARRVTLEDNWEYRRLLEVCDMLDAHDLLARWVAVGAASADAEVREAAEDFRPK